GCPGPRPGRHPCGDCAPPAGADQNLLRSRFQCCCAFTLTWSTPTRGIPRALNEARRETVNLHSKRSVVVSASRRRRDGGARRGYWLLPVRSERSRWHGRPCVSRSVPRDAGRFAANRACQRPPVGRAYRGVRVPSSSQLFTSRSCASAEALVLVL